MRDRLCKFGSSRARVHSTFVPACCAPAAPPTRVVRRGARRRVDQAPPASDLIVPACASLHRLALYAYCRGPAGGRVHCPAAVRRAPARTHGPNLPNHRHTRSKRSTASIQSSLALRSRHLWENLHDDDREQRASVHCLVASDVRAGAAQRRRYRRKPTGGHRHRVLVLREAGDRLP